MGIRTGELSVQRKNTEWFVRADSFPCTLERRPRIPNGSGGFYWGDPVPQPAQELRLVPLGIDGGGGERETADGAAVVPTYHLVGLVGSDVRRHDKFDKDGRHYEVVWLVENSQYQVKAEVWCSG